MRDYKNQAWKVEWEKLVSGYKFLAVKRWADFQEKDLTTSWIKDYVNKEWVDEDYAKLTITQRYLIDGIRRIRGRLRENLSATNTVELVSSALRVPGEARVGVGPALVALGVRGFLIPTNERDTDHKRREEKRKEEEDRLPSSKEGEPAMPECIHGDTDRFCEICKKEGFQPAPTPPPVAVVAKTSLIKAKPFPWNLAGLEGVPQEEFNRVREFHWKRSPKHYYRDTIKTRSDFEHYWPAMREAAEGWTPAAKDPVMVEILRRAGMKADPACARCHGDGGYPVLPEGRQFQQWADCECLK